MATPSIMSTPATKQTNNEFSIVASLSPDILSPISDKWIPSIYSREDWTLGRRPLRLQKRNKKEKEVRMKNKETRYKRLTLKTDDWRLVSTNDPWKWQTIKWKPMNGWRSPEHMNKWKANEGIGLFIGRRGMRNEVTGLFKTTNTKAPRVT